MRARLLRSQGSANASEMDGEEEHGGERARKFPRRGNADFRAAIGVDGAVGFAGDHGADDVADGESLESGALRFALRGESVSGFARLRNEKRDFARLDDGIAITELAGEVDFNGNPRE